MAACLSWPSQDDTQQHDRKSLKHLVCSRCSQHVSDEASARNSCTLGIHLCAGEGRGARGANGGLGTPLHPCPSPGNASSAPWGFTIRYAAARCAGPPWPSTSLPKLPPAVWPSLGCGVGAWGRLRWLSCGRTCPAWGTCSRSWGWRRRQKEASEEAAAAVTQRAESRRMVWVRGHLPSPWHRFKGSFGLFYPPSLQAPSGARLRSTFTMACSSLQVHTIKCSRCKKQYDTRTTSALCTSYVYK